MSNLGLEQNIFQKNLTGLQHLNAHQITAKVVIILVSWYIKYIKRNM